MKLSARVDYAVRAALELAAHEGTPRKAEQIADAQHIPLSFLENILSDMRQSGLVTSHRGRDGGHMLSRPATEIAIADVIRVEIGNLADIHGERPENIHYDGVAVHLTDLWVAARAAYRGVLEVTTLADAVSGKYPKQVRTLIESPDSWKSHWPAAK